MKVLCLLIACLLSQLLSAQSGQFFKKVNDSTVYRYETISKQISTDPIIPAVFNGYSGPHVQDIHEHSWILVTYDKCIDSFRLVGGGCPASKYDFQKAYDSPGVSITTSEHQSNRSFSKFFLTKVYTMVKEQLSFDVKSKTFTLNTITDPEYYFPWMRWAIAIGLFFAIFSFIKYNYFNFKYYTKDEWEKVRSEIIGGSLVGSISSAICFWFVFCIGNVPWPSVWQVGIILLIQWVIIASTGLICWNKISSQRIQNLEPA